MRKRDSLLKMGERMTCKYKKNTPLAEGIPLGKSPLERGRCGASRVC